MCSPRFASIAISMNLSVSEVTFPFVLILNAMDVANTHKTGTGLVAKAWK